jgi:hypothetical protein
MFLSGPSSDIFAVAVKFQTVLPSQVCDEFLIRVRLSSAQPMIEMDHRDDNPEFTPQFEQQSQERGRINPTGDGHADPIPSLQQVVLPNAEKSALRQ